MLSLVTLQLVLREEQGGESGGAPLVMPGGLGTQQGCAWQDLCLSAGNTYAFPSDLTGPRHHLRLLPALAVTLSSVHTERGVTQ